MNIENTERQIGPHPNVTIRHARHALHLLVNGAVLQIEEALGSTPAAEQASNQLIASLREELGNWKPAP